MPGGDRTGPLGLGPGTGWGFGYFPGYSTPGYVYPYGSRAFGFGRGFGRGLGWGRGGFGMGRGFRRAWAYPFAYNPGVYPYASYGYPDYPYAPNITPEQEADMMRKEASAMQDEINAINERIAELESKTKAKTKDKSK
jgi:hypothetical protein